MRLRRKPWTNRELDTNKALIENPAQYKGRWKELFGNDNPIHIEIGCGKGQFITDMSIKNANINYIAVEKQVIVLAAALRKAREKNTSNNIVFFASDAADLEQYFDAGEISRIYINFCDPWPNKKKWSKRRLTHKNFLSLYERIFGEKGEVFFKTDNTKLFEFSLNEISQKGWIMKNISLDLHNSDYTDNIMTEYEQKFSSQGMNIYRLEGYFCNHK